MIEVLLTAKPFEKPEIFSLPRVLISLIWVTVITIKATILKTKSTQKNVKLCFSSPIFIAWFAKQNKTFTALI